MPPGESSGGPDAEPADRERRERGGAAPRSENRRRPGASEQQEKAGSGEGEKAGGVDGGARGWNHQDAGGEGRREEGAGAPASGVMPGLAEAAGREGRRGGHRRKDVRGQLARGEREQHRHEEKPDQEEETVGLLSDPIRERAS